MLKTWEQSYYEEIEDNKRLAGEVYQLNKDKKELQQEIKELQKENSNLDSNLEKAIKLIFERGDDNFGFI